MTKYAMVPVEPDEAMKVAALDELDPLGKLIDWQDDERGATRDSVSDCYKTMLSAAPSPWRPISECPDDSRLLIAVLRVRNWPTIEFMPASHIHPDSWEYWMLASDFPLPVLREEG